ncbi:Formylglycinamide ribonucleotide amidotransferase N-terminal [Popillia japonica]|uniref:Formylglycinamide ribonucleotide amidotransferase N-terminal n=1 Tax=Popillia japonica TaxID=7064 RepID=A0AAW1MFH4_POPJA
MYEQSSIIRLYRTPAFTPAKSAEILSKLQKQNAKVQNLQTEICYHVELSRDQLSPKDLSKLKWILRSPFHPENLSEKPQLSSHSNSTLIEVGPRFNFSTSNSTNAVSICHSLDLKIVTRLEVSRRYLIDLTGSITKTEEDELASGLFDRMTECRYTESNIPRKSFNEKLVKKDDLRDVDIMGKGRAALQEINDELGLAFDESDLDYYTNLFKNILKRNPTSVECFDLAQSNSEHSRHWFFKGKMVIDGVEYEKSLIDMIIETQKHTNANNVIKFSDNSSAIKGYIHRSLKPVNAGSVSELRPVNSESHLIFTAETHNFPTGVAPFSGATTGTGGRIRDVECVGRGGYCIAGTAGYSVGNLNIEDYPLSWEDPTFEYPTNFAAPVDILIEASNGASDYGNKFGEPLISGFTRSFGMIDDQEERREWIKPIMFSGGIGFMEANMTEKEKPEKGHQIVKIGGPVYRIGVGGGSASSVEVQGDNKEELDFNAVQRGDAEMENKLNRVVRACLELGRSNPILSIHGEQIKSGVEPAGGVIYANRFDLGDPTINALELWGAEYQESNALLCKKDALELWGAEYQESNALLCKKEDTNLLREICKRERCPINCVGEVTGNGRVVLTLDDEQKIIPFNLDLNHVLGKMPRKVFTSTRIAKKLPKLAFPNDISIYKIAKKLPKLAVFPNDISIYKSLELVLRLPAVSSKRYLTNKVDRCVTGLVAQQQCVGPLHTPLANVAVTAITHFGYEGIASSIGEQPIKGLIDNIKIKKN